MYILNMFNIKLTKQKTLKTFFKIYTLESEGGETAGKGAMHRYYIKSIWRIQRSKPIYAGADNTV